MCTSKQRGHGQVCCASFTIRGGLCDWLVAFPSLLNAVLRRPAAGKRVIKKGDLRGAVREMLDTEGPYLLEVMVPVSPAFACSLLCFQQCAAQHTAVITCVTSKAAVIRLLFCPCLQQQGLQDSFTQLQECSSSLTTVCSRRVLQCWDNCEMYIVHFCGELCVECRQHVWGVACL